MARECSWTATSQAAWIQLSSATTGQGDGSVSFKVAANADPLERRGALGVADQIASVTQQAAPCKFDVQASAQEIGSTGGQTPVVVQTQDACTWNASSNATWVSLTPVSGHGYGLDHGHCTSQRRRRADGDGHGWSGTAAPASGERCGLPDSIAGSRADTRSDARAKSATTFSNAAANAAAHAGAWSLTQTAAGGQRGERQARSSRRHLSRTCGSRLTTASSMRLS